MKDTRHNNSLLMVDDRLQEAIARLDSIQQDTGCPVEQKRAKRIMSALVELRQQTTELKALS